MIEKGSQPPAQNAKVAPILSLFKHADGKDKIQLFFGTICALAVGCSFPFFMIFFGDIIDIFFDVNRSRSAELAFDVTKKFFIIGGATWVLSKENVIIQVLLDCTVGISQDQTNHSDLKRCITKLYWTNKWHGMIQTMSTNWPLK